MRNLVFAAVFISMTLFYSSVSVSSSEARNEIVFMDMVTSVNMHELYLAGIRFFLSPDVKIYLNSDGGRTVTLKSLVSVGRIERARIYVTGSEVRKIVVLEMTQ